MQRFLNEPNHLFGDFVPQINWIPLTHLRYIAAITVIRRLNNQGKCCSKIIFAKNHLAYESGQFGSKNNRRRDEASRTVINCFRTGLELHAMLEKRTNSRIQLRKQIVLTQRAVSVKEINNMAGKLQAAQRNCVILLSRITYHKNSFVLSQASRGWSSVAIDGLFGCTSRVRLVRLAWESSRPFSSRLWCMPNEAQYCRHRLEWMSVLMKWDEYSRLVTIMRKIHRRQK